MTRAATGVDDTKFRMEPDGPAFTEVDELRWHQLDLLRRILPSFEEPGSQDQAPAEEARPKTWGISTEVTPYPWQNSALKAWEQNGRLGVVKVVTGAGKTMLALMCLERLLREDPSVRASIVVPTRVLLDQWYQELTGTLGLSPEWVGRRSGKHKDDFCRGRRVMIYVVNSARTALGRPLHAEELRSTHLLVVDECHRAGSAENSKIFEVPRRFSLGLSATPERDVETPPDSDASGEEASDVISRELGPIIYQLTFKEALDEGIVPPFELIHAAVPLTLEERRTYDKLGREIKQVRDRLRQEPAYLKRRSEVSNEFVLIKSLARGRLKASKLAARYEALTNARKELLYRAENRRECFESILEEERSVGDVRVMAFHERISEINRLFEGLVRDQKPVVVDHTGITETQRERSLKLYLQGTAPILLSVKAMIEGVNAPATDIGVIVAASSSPRQKIQSLGRVMRTYPGKETSRIYNIYVDDSVDERIFRRVNFEQILGTGGVEYRRWLGPGQWEALDGPPHTPLPSDSDLDEERLRVGDLYPGKDEGLELSISTQGNVYRNLRDGERTTREFGSIPTEVVEAIRQIRPDGGPIRVTHRCRHVLVPSRDAEGRWRMYYGGRLSEPIVWRRPGRERIPLKVSARYGGSIVVAGGSRNRKKTTHDVRSPAAQRILALVRGWESEAESVYEIELARCGDVYARVGSIEHRLGSLGEADGWPFGKKSFDDLRQEPPYGN